MALSKLKGVFALCLAPLVFSCGRGKADQIPLDNSDPLALAPDVRWALVDDPYAAFRSATSWDADVVGYCKQGELFPVLASASVSGERGSEAWYLFEDGWLPESVLSIYSNKLRAQKAAKSLGAQK